MNHILMPTFLPLTEETIESNMNGYAAAEDEPYPFLRVQQTNEREGTAKTNLVMEGTNRCKNCDVIFPTSQALELHNRSHLSCRRKAPPNHNINVSSESEDFLHAEQLSSITEVYEAFGLLNDSSGTNQHESTIQNVSEGLHESSQEYDDYSLSYVLALGSRHSAGMNKGGGGDNSSILKPNPRNPQPLPMHQEQTSTPNGKHGHFDTNWIGGSPATGGFNQKGEVFKANHMTTLKILENSVTNFPIGEHKNETKEMQDVTILDEVVMPHKKKAKGISKGSSGDSSFSHLARLATRNSYYKGISDARNDHGKSSSLTSHGPQEPQLQSNPTLFLSHGSGMQTFDGVLSSHWNNVIGMETFDGGLSSHGAENKDSSMEKNDDNIIGEYWTGLGQLMPSTDESKMPSIFPQSPSFDSGHPSLPFTSGSENPNSLIGYKRPNPESSPILIYDLEAISSGLEDSGNSTDCLNVGHIDNVALQRSSIVEETAKIIANDRKGKGVMEEENIVQPRHEESANFLKLNEAEADLANWLRGEVAATGQGFIAACSQSLVGCQLSCPSDPFLQKAIQHQYLDHDGAQLVGPREFFAFSLFSNFISCSTMAFSNMTYLLHRIELAEALCMPLRCSTGEDMETPEVSRVEHTETTFDLNKEFTPNNQTTAFATTGNPVESSTRGSNKARTSVYRGVSRPKSKEIYEAHVYGIASVKGTFDTEEEAAKAHDLFSLKYWGAVAPTNFPKSNYEKELRVMSSMTMKDVLATIKRSSSRFARSNSSYRGVTRSINHRQIQLSDAYAFSPPFLSNFGTGLPLVCIDWTQSSSTEWPDTEEEAAMAFDIASIKSKGYNALTNFNINKYDVKSIQEGTEEPKIDLESATLLKEATVLWPLKKKRGMTSEDKGEAEAENEEDSNDFLNVIQGAKTLMAMHASVAAIQPFPTSGLHRVDSSSLHDVHYAKATRLRPQGEQEACNRQRILHRVDSSSPQSNYFGLINGGQEAKAQGTGFYHASTSCFKPYSIGD
ncbi:hypothetical protein RJ639_017473 [Escallonia herrerae]|uniref:Uncharacterized protein n=1 Tax=Escallonia herrerae TaxID=1293975 RepID=A0AA88VFS1_9ASTE|nr:hypothetical protein RJ639_017473 [Escallonia herrerae]